MSFFPYALRFKNVFSGPTLKNFKALVITSSKNTNFSTLCSPLKVNQNQILLLPKPFSSVRLYVNPASTVSEFKKETHSRIWVAERFVSIGLLSLIPLALADPSLEDAEIVLDVLIALHVHWGLEAIFKDYLRPSVVGEVIPKFCDLYAALVSVYLAVSLVWISVYGIGVVKTVKHLWCLDPNIN